MSDDAKDPVLEHLIALFNNGAVPEPSDELRANPRLMALHEQVVQVRDILFAFSKGDLSPEIHTRGFLAGCLKALQAHLRHMTWQVQQVEQGDFEQRLEFLGDFSLAFNKMVIKLADTLNALKKKEEALTELTNELKVEVDQRGTEMEALQENAARLQYLASHDPLTGALNRRSFMEQTLLFMNAAEKDNLPCCIALLDIDHFKKFNDIYGHLAGDAVLKHLVQVSTKMLRNADVFGRYGGEEFIFYFNSADLGQGEMVANRVRRALQDSPVELESGPVQVTVSIGVTVRLPGNGEATDEELRQLIKTADMGLYKAKAGGRNSVVSVDSQNDMMARLQKEVLADLKEELFDDDAL